MGIHNESQDTSVSSRSDVMVETGPVELTRRQWREAEASLRHNEIQTVDLDSVSVVKLVAEVVSEADAAIAEPVASVTAPQPLSNTASTPVEHVAPTSRKSSRRAQEALQTAAQRPAPTRSAPPRGIAASTKRSHRRRRATARLLSVTAMLFVAAMAVATSVPANALLSAQDVENLNVAQAKDVGTPVQSGQSIEASGSDRKSVV